MKRSILILLACVLALLCACAAKPEPTEPQGSSSAAPSEPSSEPVPSTEESSSAPSKTEPPTASFKVTDQRLNVYRNRAEEFWGQVITAVQNTGDAPIYLQDSTFHITDAEGKSLASDTTVSAYPQIVAPGETGYYYAETYLETESAEGLTLEFTPQVSVSAQQKVEYTVENPDLQDSRYGGMELRVTLSNSTAQDTRHYCVAVLLFDAEGKLLGQFYDVPSVKVPAGGSAVLELSSYMLPDTVTKAEIADYRILAYELQD
mgnify:FL=1